MRGFRHRPSGAALSLLPVVSWLVPAAPATCLEAGPPGHRTIHIATHDPVDDERPEQSTLVLVGDRE